MEQQFKGAYSNTLRSESLDGLRVGEVVLLGDCIADDWDVVQDGGLYVERDGLLWYWSFNNNEIHIPVRDFDVWAGGCDGVYIVRDKEILFVTMEGVETSLGIHEWDTFDVYGEYLYLEKDDTFTRLSKDGTKHTLGHHPCNAWNAAPYGILIDLHNTFTHVSDFGEVTPLYAGGENDWISGIFSTYGLVLNEEGVFSIVRNGIRSMVRVFDCHEWKVGVRGIYCKINDTFSLIVLK